MKTKGGEFKCVGVTNFAGCGMGPDGTYVGAMHRHTDGRLMAGAKHSDKKHPILKPVNKKASIKNIASKNVGY
tara:strand:+ start:16298 stop:16516 length:219 start_codon:yes stop_codon:yes gene_type:complete